MGYQLLLADGQWLVFERGRIDENGDITEEIVKASTSSCLAGSCNVTVLTSGTDLRFPRWSPNGNQISYIRNGDYYIMGASGGIGTRPFSLGADVAVSALTWSPDGSHLVGAASRQTANVNSYYLLLATTNGAVSTLSNPNVNQFLRNPDWSGSGNQIVFDNTVSIYVMEGVYQGAFIRPAGGAGGYPRWWRGDIEDVCSAGGSGGESGQGATGNSGSCYPVTPPPQPTMPPTPTLTPTPTASVTDELLKYGVYVIIDPTVITVATTRAQLQAQMETEILIGVQVMDTAFGNFFTGPSMQGRYTPFNMVFRSDQERDANNDRVPFDVPEVDDNIVIVFLFTTRPADAPCRAEIGISHFPPNVTLPAILAGKNIRYGIACSTALAQATPGFSHYTAVHELGHSFTATTGATNTCWEGSDVANCDRERYSFHEHINSPRWPLNNTQDRIVVPLGTNFRFVMGRDPVTNLWDRGLEGWGSPVTPFNNPPVFSACYFQQNLTNIPNEAAADMFLNWIYETADNAFGQTVNGNPYVGFEDIAWSIGDPCPLSASSPSNLRTFTTGQARFDYMNTVMTYIGSIEGWN